MEACCSAITQKEFPVKHKDLRSFIILITIEILCVDMTLLDSSACINLMPLSTLMRVGDVEVNPTRMTLQLVDHSFKYPHGLVGNILMKVGKLSFLVDFVVTDMAANSRIPIVLG